MFIKDSFDHCVKTRLTGEMGESDVHSIRNTRDLDKDGSNTVKIFSLAFSYVIISFPVYCLFTSKLKTESCVSFYYLQTQTRIESMVDT